MSKTRIENFSDGIFSIIITLMVFQFRTPANGSFSGIFNPAFLNMLVVYLVTFMNVAGFWVGHHLALENLKRADTGFLWANTAVIFPITLLPFSTRAYGTFESSSVAAILYTANYLLANIGIMILILLVIRRFHIHHTINEKLHESIIHNLQQYCITAIPLLLFSYFFPRETIYLILILTSYWVNRSIRLDHRLQELRKRSQNKD